MKKIVLSIVGSLLISVCAVQAQRYDTAGTASNREGQQDEQQYEKSRKQTDQTQPERQAWRQSDKSGDGSQANEGMVIIDKEEIPASLKETLKQEKYAGWENGTIYHNTNTDEYVIAPRAYRFDEQGKEIDPGQSAQAQGQDRSSRTQDQGADAQDQPSRAQDEAARAQDQSSRAQDEAARAQDESSRAQDQSAQMQDQASREQDRSYDQSKYNEQLRKDRTSEYDQQRDDQSTSARQDDATSKQDQSNAYRSDTEDDQQSDRTSRSQPGQDSDDAYRSHQLTEGMTEIEADQISPSLRRTLNEGDYDGWEEEGVFYQDPATNEVVLIMKNTDDASQSHFYRFDKKGKLKESQTGSGQK